MRLENKVALVTGSASGIGASIAKCFAAEGSRVIGFDLAPSECELALTVDVADEYQVREATAHAIERFGRIDVLSTNAGIAIRKRLDELTSEEWDRVIRVNLRGVFLISKYAIPHMPRGASVIHMASGVGLVGVRNRAVYTATKGAIVSLTRNMALDYAQRGIRVNCICPGFTRTALTRALFEDPEREAAFTALHPLGRLGEPEDIANAALFLAGEESAWITGIALPVDGGFAAGHAEDI